MTEYDQFLKHYDVVRTALAEVLEADVTRFVDIEPDEILEQLDTKLGAVAVSVEEEPESENPIEPPPPQINELEDGIFNMVVTLALGLRAQHGADKAREEVVGYLRRLIEALESLANTDVNPFDGKAQQQ